MNFVSSILNQIPVVGHVKASIHMLAGDSIGANKAFHQCNRATAVFAGGIAGGPLGAVGAGIAVDAVMSIGTQDPQGVIRSIGNIADDIDRGKVPIMSTIETVLTPACDAIGGKVSGKMFDSVMKISVAAPVLVEESGKSAVKLAAKKIVVMEAAVIADNIAVASAPVMCQATLDVTDSALAFRTVNGSPPTRPSGGDSSTSTGSPIGEGPSNPTKRSTSGNSSTSSKNPSAGSPTGGGPPNNPPKHTTETEEETEISLEDILEVLKKYFPNMGPHGLNRLKLLLKTIINNGFDMRILVIVFAICKSLEMDDDVMIFSSLAEFLMVYIQEQLFELMASSSDCDITVEILREIIIINLLKCPCIPDTVWCALINDFKRFFKDMAGVKCINGDPPTLEAFINFLKNLLSEIIVENRHSHFRDVYSALYHYYKHQKVVSMHTGEVRVLTVVEYFNLVEDTYLELQLNCAPLYEQMMKTLEGRESNTRKRIFRIEYVSHTKLSSYGRSFRLVIKLQNGRIVVASLHWVDTAK